jgi:hypothetical protein
MTSLQDKIISRPSQINADPKNNKIFRYKHTSLISDLNVYYPQYYNKKHRIKNIKLFINDVEIKLHKPNPSNNVLMNWNFKDIREHIRNLDPENEDDILLKRLEQTFVYNGLKAIQFYSNLTHDDLANTIFTLDLDIYFEFICDSNNPPKKIPISDNYIISDIKKEQN